MSLLSAQIFMGLSECRVPGSRTGARLRRGRWLHPCRQEFRQGVQKLLRPFEVRYMAGAVDLDKLPIRQFLDGGAPEHRPIAEWFDILGLGVAAKEDASDALPDD